MSPSVKIVVATHKAAPTPHGELYLTLQAGRSLHPALNGMIGDNTGENISYKNESYCELTCLYWAWKNLRADYIGLCHYRRYFGDRRIGSKWNRILQYEQAQALLQNVPILLPKPRHYYIETTYTHYAHAHHIEDLDRTRQIIAQRCPGYLPAFDKVMSRTWGHRFNMLLMRRDLLDDYCAWLFRILFALETVTDIRGYDAYNQRVYGFIAERLLDVWIETNQIPYKELPVVNMESQHWPRKIAAFLQRKFCPYQNKKRMV